MTRSVGSSSRKAMVADIVRVTRNLVTDEKFTTADLSSCAARFPIDKSGQAGQMQTDGKWTLISAADLS